mmetsp:Transcript_6847/g.7869  ORF Transcript_6847/g.7869 Transcript_6847/m.7869 type:complete len:334 (+) Transcript_6847:275-1276(+)
MEEQIRELELQLRDFYNYHDPFKTDKELRVYAKFGAAKGIDQLNARLRKKFGEDLTSPAFLDGKEETIKFSTLKAPTVLDANYDIVSKSKDPTAMKQKISALLINLATSNSPQDIRMNLVDLYRVVEPVKFNESELGPKIREQVEWACRYSLMSLVYTLRETYLNRARLSKKNDSGDYRKPPETMSAAEIAKLREDLTSFFLYFNPATLENGIEDIIEVIQKRGIDFMNSHLRSCYGEDLTTFGQNEADAGKADIYDQLYEFFCQYDSSRLGEGLAAMVEWTAEHGEDALNRQLKKRYGFDLSDVSLEKKSSIATGSVTDVSGFIVRGFSAAI